MDAPKKSRDTRLDMLRGLFLVIMAGVHVPTPLSRVMQEPFGYTSAAEGFVFLGASLAGCVYEKIFRQSGLVAMYRRVWARVRLIYTVHLLLLIPIVLIAWAAAGHLAPLANQFHEFLQNPIGSLAFIPALLHQPPLFDILPLYVVLLGATPLLLLAARRFGWRAVLLVSIFVWLLAQFKLSFFGLDALARRLPLQLSSFNYFAWQLLWVGGLAIGATAVRRKKFRREIRVALVVIASVIVLAGLLSRHGFWPQACFNPDLYLWMDKWTLGPLRLLNFAAWVVLLVIWNPKFSPALLSPLALLGRHSLAVFAVHIPLVIAATTAVQMFSLSTTAQVVVGILVIAALFPWAAWQESRSRRAARQTVMPVAVPAVPPTALQSETPAPELVVAR